MSDYNKYKESHLRAQKKYDDANREKKHQYDKLRWQRQKENNRLVNKYKEIFEKISEYVESTDFIYDEMYKKRDKIIFLLRDKDKPEYLGYSDKECINCGRERVEKYSDGTEICEKCNFDQNKKEYVMRRR